MGGLTTDVPPPRFTIRPKKTPNPVLARFARQNCPNPAHDTAFADEIVDVFPNRSVAVAVIWVPDGT